MCPLPMSRIILSVCGSIFMDSVTWDLINKQNISRYVEEG